MLFDLVIRLGDRRDFGLAMNTRLAERVDCAGRMLSPLGVAGVGPMLTLVEREELLVVFGARRLWAAVDP